MAGYGVRAYLIGQSLNQIEKAYGPNNAILDNCHVRIAFSTNDERTAKRISESLGTKTELRSQKNYTGHRLAPWLSHMMVSRQETQRALMTPGEVMQMPSDDEVVMASGVPPILAKKLRYFKDRNFVCRVLPPPKEMPKLTDENSNWHMVTDVNSMDGARVVGKDIDDSQEISPTCDRPSRAVMTQIEPEVSSEGDDVGDIASKQTLETIRRAAALDLADDNTLPEF